MKFFLALGLLLAFQSASALDAKGIEKFLEDLRLRMCHPIEKLGLPALDPLSKKEMESFELNVKDFLMVDGFARRFEMLGLSDFIINEIKFPSILRQNLVIDLTFPNTTFDSDYKANGTAGYVFPIDGRGDLRGHVSDVQIRIEAKVKIGLRIQISNFKLIFKVGEIYLFAERLVPDERINDFLHAVVNELGLELLEYIWGEKHESLDKAIESKINAYLKDKPLSEIIGGGSGEPIFGEDAPPPDCKPDWGVETK
ncbi:hypothetical protein ACFFRR_007973 [Megaselia abdita]